MPDGCTNAERIMETWKLGLLVGAALCASALQSEAQSGSLKLREINFDMWCQEHRHLPPARCDKRLPQDDAAFQQYVNTIERYETQRLNSEAQERSIGRMINADPIDNPIQPSTPSAGHSPR
jgi:hypothetical protein